MKQAFLIIAHDNFLVLEKLIEALVSPRVDIYLHLDAKVKMIPESLLNNKDIIILRKRIDTRWGDVSQIETEYVLLEEAYKKGEYSHYHIISGTHYPLMPIEKIVNYFDSLGDKTVFYWLCKSNKEQELLKVRRYNYFTRYLAVNNGYVSTIAQKLRRFALMIQSCLGVERNKQISFYKASNWASFSEEAVSYLIDNKSRVMDIFNKSFCGDEFFAPTLLMTSPLKDKILNNNKLLIQKMGEANPVFLNSNDYSFIVSSGCMYARKFSDSCLDVIEQLNAGNV